MIKFLKWLKTKLVALFKATWKQLKDRTNLIIYIIVNIVVSSEVWVPYLLALITGDKWWWGIGSACWAFWIGPFTPFTAICIGLTVAIRKVYDKLKAKRKKRKEKKDHDNGTSADGAAERDARRECIQRKESEDTRESSESETD